MWSCVLSRSIITKTEGQPRHTLVESVGNSEEAVREMERERERGAGVCGWGGGCGGKSKLLGGG